MKIKKLTRNKYKKKNHKGTVLSSPFRPFLTLYLVQKEAIGLLKKKKKKVVLSFSSLINYDN